MTPEKWEKVGRIFHSAAVLDGEERTAFLRTVCSGDDELLREVESLISADNCAEEFIAEPAVNVAELEPPDEPESLAGALLGHYRIETSIGRGGMGEVYLATDTRLNRKVALKKLPDQFIGDPAFVRRFRIEAQAAAGLNHPNVATIYSVEESDGKPFITMEYVDGKTLEDLTPAGGLDLGVFLDWFIQLSGALRHAHEKGVTHRDIKPGNIMIAADGVPKILDFGLAQISAGAVSPSGTTANITEPGQVIGTPSYMSPEQAEGKEVDGRSDIFSFGVVMYEALTGVRPFSGSSHAELVSNLLKSDPPMVSDLRPGVPLLVVRLIARCLAKRRRERPQNMQEVRTILSEAKAVMNAGVTSNSLGQRLYREASSPSMLWQGGAVLAVILASFSGWYFFPLDSASPLNFENMTIRRLSQTQNVVFAHISRDGRSVAYNTIEANENRSLWIRRIEDRNALQLIEPQPVQFWGGLTMSDDGNNVFYITAERSARHGTLYRVSSLGGPPRKLVETVNDLGSLSPDGKRMLYIRYSEPVTLLSANVEDGSDERIVTAGAPGDILRDPHYSPDGLFIYFIKLERSDGVEFWSLRRLSVDGSEEVTIVPNQRERISEIAFWDDPNALLLNAADPESSLSQLYYVSLPDGGRTRITNDLNSYFGVSVDATGSNVVAAQRYDEKRVWVGETSNLAGMKPVSAETNAYLTADWTPDGRLVHDAVDNNRPHIWICDEDGDNPQQLTPNSSDDFQPVVSMDGRFIIFTSTRDGFNQIWRMNIDGSNQVLLARVDGLTSAARLAPDRSSVIFHWFRDGRRTLGRVPIEGGETVEMPLFGDAHWAISPDGSMVAYSAWDEAANRVKVIIEPIGSERPNRTLDIAPTYILKWTADSRGLVYRERQAGDNPEATVMEWLLTAAEPIILFSTEPEYVIDFTYSRDGKKAAAVRGRLITDAVLLASRSPAK